MTLNFDFRGVAKAKQGSKSVYVQEVWCGSKRNERMVVRIFYEDTSVMVSKRPSYCKSRESAERMVNRFFNEQ